VLRPGERAGFVCTNSVAQNEGREAAIDPLISRGGTITDAWRSYPWPGEAAVHIAIVNWVMNAYDGIRMLDGREVPSISPSLTETIDVTTARQLKANERLCFMGVTPGNKEFVLTEDQRQAILAEDPKSAPVIRPFLIARDVNREIDQRPTRWIIDFEFMTKDEAEAFPGAMRHVRKYVYPIRSRNRREAYARRWWSFVEPRPGLRFTINGMKHVLAISTVGPHLLVTRQPSGICFDHQLMVVALKDYYHFGVLQSRLHAIWAWARGSTLEERLRYTNTTVFETFPFPLLPDGKYDPRVRPKTPEADRLAEAAEAFDRLRGEKCRERGEGLTKIHNGLEAGEHDELRAAYDAMNDALDVCYGFPAGTWRDQGAALAALLDLNATLWRREGGAGA
jgi:hypothetical protein